MLLVEDDVLVLDEVEDDVEVEDEVDDVEVVGREQSAASIRSKFRFSSTFPVYVKPMHLVCVAA